MERLSLWLTKRHASITVVDDNGVTREISGRSMTDVMDNLSPADYAAFVAFCAAVASFAAGNAKALEGM